MRTQATMHGPTESQSGMCTTPPQRLLAHTDLLLLLADLLRPPNRVLLPSLKEAAELACAAGADKDESSFVELISVFANAPIQDWSDEYHRLFEGPLLCPVNETAYVRRDKGAILADLAGFYRAFGFVPSRDAGEKPDHLRCELEFLAMLFVMLVQAIERQSEGDQKVTCAAIRDFAADHLNDWICSFAVHLAQATHLKPYLLLAEELSSHWRLIAHAIDLPVIAAPLETASPKDMEGDWPMECGMASEQPAPPCALTVEGRVPTVGTDRS